MPALVPTNHTGRIEWLGRVENREETLASVGLDKAFLSFAGVEGEEHAGLSRPSCSRVLSQYSRDTEIRNVRQLSIVCGDELDEIAKRLGIPRLDPSWIGTSIVIRGIPDFSHLPPSSRLQFGNGTTVTVDMQNRPCHLPVKVIEAHAPGRGKGFKQSGVGLRGITAWVEREGEISMGDTVTLHVPDQRAWKHA